MGTSGSIPVALSDAVISGDMESVRNRLNENQNDINRQDDWWSTPLHIALNHGQLDVAEVLLSQGADCNLQSRDGEAPIHVAARRGYPAMCKLLAENGGDVNLTALGRRTPLHFAAFEGRDKVISQLLLDGTDIESTTTDGETALHIAASTGAKDIVAILLEGGSDIDAQRKDGMTPLLLAVKEMEEQTAQVLINRGANINLVSYEGKTVLHFAAYSGLLDITRALLAKGVDVNSEANDKCTALHEACTLGHRAIVKTLLDAGAEVNAAAHTFPQVIIFMRSIWDVNFTPTDDQPLIPGATPLVRAAENDNGDIVDMLLRRGANVLAFDNYGRWPLHWAVRNNNCRISHLLLKYGTPFPLTDLNGYNFLAFYFFYLNVNAIGFHRLIAVDQLADMTVLFLQHGVWSSRLEAGEGMPLLCRLCERHCLFPLRVYEAVLNSGDDVRTTLSMWSNCIHTFKRDKKYDIVEYVLLWVKQPLSLQQWCRITLRAYMSTVYVDKSIWKATVALPLPRSLVNFILLQEFQNTLLE